jgi:hypothetical protein
MPPSARPPEAEWHIAVFKMDTVAGLESFGSLTNSARPQKADGLPEVRRPPESEVPRPVELSRAAKSHYTGVATLENSTGRPFIERLRRWTANR